MVYRNETLVNITASRKQVMFLKKRHHHVFTSIVSCCKTIPHIVSTVQKTSSRWTSCTKLQKTFRPSNRYVEEKLFRLSIILLGETASLTKQPSCTGRKIVSITTTNKVYQLVGKEEKFVFWRRRNK